MRPMTADKVTEPGAYEWVTPKGARHIGFIKKEARGGLTGAFVAEDCESRAISLRYSDGSLCEGMFYGPLPMAPNR